MSHTVFHIEDETTEFQAQVWKLISKAADAGIQLTPLDFRNDDGFPTLDGMDATEWVGAMTGDYDE
jgi:hypothetical protein